MSDNMKEAAALAVGLICLLVLTVLVILAVDTRNRMTTEHQRRQGNLDRLNQERQDGERILRELSQ